MFNTWLKLGLPVLRNMTFVVQIQANLIQKEFN